MRARSGPGKYDTNTSRINDASGHGSAFKQPTERKIKNKYASSAVEDTPTRGRSKRSSSPKGGAKKAAPTDAK